MRTKFILLTLLAMLIGTQTACWEVPDNGTVLVETYYGKASRIIRSPGIWTPIKPGYDYYPLPTTTETSDDIVVRGSSKDNAPFKWTVRLTYKMPDNDMVMLNHINKFGAERERRNAQVSKSLILELQSQVSTAANAFEAYALVENSAAAESKVLENMKTFFNNNIYLELENLQLVGKPDFDNDDIDNAAGRVIAAKKNKEIAELDLAKSKVEAETKQVQAQTFAQSPALLEIRKLELKKEEAQAWAQHNGTLVFGNNSPLQLINK